jgi:hypothetical protein
MRWRRPWANGACGDVLQMRISRCASEATPASWSRRRPDPQSLAALQLDGELQPAAPRPSIRRRRGASDRSAVGRCGGRRRPCAPSAAMSPECGAAAADIDDPLRLQHAAIMVTVVRCTPGTSARSASAAVSPPTRSRACAASTGAPARSARCCRHQLLRASSMALQPRSCRATPPCGSARRLKSSRRGRKLHHGAGEGGLRAALRQSRSPFARSWRYRRRAPRAGPAGPARRAGRPA